ncbi:hypothetical protein [Marinomonas flavescens]|uniref:hypothetical protein n=1 Tax=Marinomonas flavescens TaxID=2529379 RepID=UPI001054A075|nr:hypothetical protein [Marinomonas flavescens]
MKKIIGVAFLYPLMTFAQTVEIQPVDIIYGNQVIHGRHQVVLNSPDKVAIIPAEQKKASPLGLNVVVTDTGDDRSYLERKTIAAREQAIYDEVNKRTKDAPFTVLFTGHIPDDIQEKRLRMMPEIGVFGDQLNKLDKAQGANTAQSNTLDTGEFSEVRPNNSGATSTTKSKPVATQEDKLEKLIGG